MINEWVIVLLGSVNKYKYVLYLECGVSCMSSDLNKILYYKLKIIVIYSDRLGLERDFNIY